MSSICLLVNIFFQVGSIFGVGLFGRFGEFFGLGGIFLLGGFRRLVVFFGQVRSWGLVLLGELFNEGLDRAGDSTTQRGQGRGKASCGTDDKSGYLSKKLRPVGHGCQFVDLLCGEDLAFTKGPAQAKGIGLFGPMYELSSDVDDGFATITDGAGSIEELSSRGQIQLGQSEPGNRVLDHGHLYTLGGKGGSELVGNNGVEANRTNDYKGLQSPPVFNKLFYQESLDSGRGLGSDCCLGNHLLSRC